MSFQKFKGDSYCVGGRHRSATKNIYGDKTSECKKGLVGYNSKCNRKKTMFVSDNTTQVQVLGDFFNYLGEKRYIASKEISKNVLINPGKDFEIGANLGSAFASGIPEAALSWILEVINHILSYMYKIIPCKLCSIFYLVNWLHLY